MTTQTRTLAAAAALTLAAGAALANPVNGFYFDGPMCDSHGDRVFTEELGTGPLFPADELISATFSITQTTACPVTDDPTLDNFLVEITNLTGDAWTDLFYVADPDSAFSNVDGLAVSAAAPGAVGEAVRIDMLGVNRVLIFESMTTDGVFEIGETWAFLLQDWSNGFGLGPADMGSLDFAGASAGDSLSTGSILATRVPAPSSLTLLSAGALCIARRRR